MNPLRNPHGRKQKQQSKKTFRMLRRPFINPNQVYRYKRTFIATTIASSAGTDKLGSFVFKLADVPNVSEFTSLYDVYRIAGVKMVFYPASGNLVYDVTQQNATGIPLSPAQPGSLLPRFMTVIDEDDNTTPGSTSDLLQYQTLKITSGTKHVVYLKPRFSATVYKNLAASGYAVGPRKQWLDCSDSTTEHYGVKYAYESTPSLTPVGMFNMKVHITYYLEFKDVR